MENGSPSDLRDEELVALCQGGERRAFESLVLRYMKKAYQIAFDFTRDGEEAKDLSQEAFLRAFSQIHRFDRRSSFYTWFYRILVNLCIDHHRHKSRIPWEHKNGSSQDHTEAETVADTSSTPDQEAIAGEVRRKLGTALGGLPKGQRTAFLLRNHHGLSIAEIAKVMQTTEGTVRVQLHRAVTTLRESLGEFA